MTESGPDGSVSIAPSREKTRQIILGLLVADIIQAVVRVWDHFTLSMFALRFIEGLFVSLLILPILLAVGQIVEDRQNAKDRGHVPPAP